MVLIIIYKSFRCFKLPLTSTVVGDMKVVGVLNVSKICFDNDSVIVILDENT